MRFHLDVGDVLDIQNACFFESLINERERGIGREVLKGDLEQVVRRGW